jgi:hypothetical protein
MSRIKRQGHTSTHRGKRVLVELRDGTVFVDRFVDRLPNKTLILERYGRLRAGLVASFITSPKIIAAKVGDA